jgi:hypothetical protein
MVLLTILWITVPIGVVAFILWAIYPGKKKTGIKVIDDLFK